MYKANYSNKKATQLYTLYFFHISSSKATYTANQLIIYILTQIWAFYNDAF